MTTVGSAPDNSVVLEDAPVHLATFEEKDGQVTLRAHDPTLTLHNATLSTGNQQSVIGTGDDGNSALVSGTFHLWVFDRGGRRYLRIKDSQAPALKHFHGHRIQARWIPNSPPYVMQEMNKLVQIIPVTVPVHVEFELHGPSKLLYLCRLTKSGFGSSFEIRRTSTQPMVEAIFSKLLRHPVD
jgi:hypothetical protein